MQTHTPHSGATKQPTHPLIPILFNIRWPHLLSAVCSVHFAAYFGAPLNYLCAPAVLRRSVFSYEGQTFFAYMHPGGATPAPHWKHGMSLMLMTWMQQNFSERLRRLCGKTPTRRTSTLMLRMPATFPLCGWKSQISGDKFPLHTTFYYSMQTLIKNALTIHCKSLSCHKWPSTLLFFCCCDFVYL